MSTGVDIAAAAGVSTSRRKTASSDSSPSAFSFTIGSPPQQTAAAATQAKQQRQPRHLSLSATKDRTPPPFQKPSASDSTFSYTIGSSPQSQSRSQQSSSSSSTSSAQSNSFANVNHRNELSVDSSLLSTFHSRQRRQERDISKIDLKMARRYGMEVDNSSDCYDDTASFSSPSRLKSTRKIRHNNCAKKFIYGGKVFIYNPITNQEITCYPSVDYASDRSGTKVMKPIRLEKVLKYDTPDAQQVYDNIRRTVISQQQNWTSHSVLVVDTSGSMRRDDVNGGRCRSDAVWLVLARDFVKKQLQSKTATLNDVVSVILMNRQAEAKLICYPMHWYLYNMFLEYREWNTIRPQGPGNYMPALRMAEKLLNINTLGSCALSLMCFSDGKPSDHGEPFVKKMGQIASKFGRRLSVLCIGMMDDSDSGDHDPSATQGISNSNEIGFKSLMDMVTEAETYGSKATFNRPNLSCDSLSNIVSSLVSTLNTSKTEMTDLRTGTSRTVRVDLRRERKGAPDDQSLNSNWDSFYSTKDSVDYIPDMWTWDYQQDKFVTLMDPRCVGCYKQVGNNADHADESKGFRCPACKACFFCHKCTTRGVFKSHHEGSVCPRYARDRRNGHFVKQVIPSWSLAIKKLVYGEGAERIVYKVRFLNENGCFFGPKMVAKESRFLEVFDEVSNSDGVNGGDYNEKLAYHEEFARTQALASQLADKFNAALDALVDHFDNPCHPWLKRMPRMRFLKPLVVEAFIGSDGGKTRNILIEEQLEGEYRKFNNNMGWHDGKNGVAVAVNKQGQGDLVGGLDVIAEGSEEEDDPDDADDGEDGLFHSNQTGPEYGEYNAIRNEDFPQAFSHFTYEKSKKQLMVVDLQGIFRANPDGTSEYVLTDPAIHKRKRSKRSNKLAGWTFGRTDRGEKGMKAFFDTHVCTDACRLLGLENIRDRKV